MFWYFRGTKIELLMSLYGVVIQRNRYNKNKSVIIYFVEVER